MPIISLLFVHEFVTFLSEDPCAVGIKSLKKKSVEKVTEQQLGMCHSYFQNILKNATAGPVSP